MFGIEVTFLTGRYVASSFNDRKQPEWPPHPARMYSALVAEYAEAGFCLKERDVLEWLESLGSPEIYAPPAENRSVIGYFVPVNDSAIVSIDKYHQIVGEVENLSNHIKETRKSNGQLNKVERLQRKLDQRINFANSLAEHAKKTSPDSAVKMFPDQRTKQLRYFPSSTLRNPRVTFIWYELCPESKAYILDELLSRVTRLGHSSSLVSCRITDRPQKANYTLSCKGGNSVMIRGIRTGQLEELIKQFEVHQGFKPRVLPYEIVEYRNTEKLQPSDETIVESNLAGDWIVFEFLHDSRNYFVTLSHEVAKTMRASIFRYIDDPIPEEISGHKSDGQPTSKPHIAFQPIPFVGHQYADGRLLGIAILIPKSIEPSAKRALIKAIGRWEHSVENSRLKLYLSSNRSISFQRLIGRSNLRSLQRSIWSKPSLRWTSVTPVALPRHPGRLFGGTNATRKKAWKSAENAVIQSCAHVNLPEPVNITISSEPLLAGCKSSRNFPSLQYNKGSANLVTRQLIHTTLEFPMMVQGPLVLGSGRFLGLGLMHPVHRS